MSDNAIKIEGLSKVYRIGARQKQHNQLREAVVDTLFSGVSRLVGRTPRKDDENTIWALKDINLEVKRGEVLGIIGRNGAGKSTLLKILSRITEPTKGRVEIRGRVGSLLEVGTGFHPELTGRENIMLNGAILGMSRDEIKKKFDEIVAFSEIEKFIDTPVKHYSSGMFVRLAFAVAAHMDPEILLVDEVLAVGDVAFQKKCLGKMDNVTKEGRTVLFVSHNMGAVKTICNKALCIANGIVEKFGHADDVVDFYLQLSTDFIQEDSAAWKHDQDTINISSEITLLSVELFDSSGRMKNTYSVEEQIKIAIKYKVNTDIKGLRIIIQLQTSDGIVAFTSYEDSSILQGLTAKHGYYVAECNIPPNLFNIDSYIVFLSLDIPNEKSLIPFFPAVRIHIIDTSSYSRYLHCPRGVLRPKLEWSNHLYEG